MKWQSLSAVLVLAGICPIVASAQSEITIYAGPTHSNADSQVPHIRDASTHDTFGSKFSGTGYRVGGAMTFLEWVGVDVGWARFGKESGLVHLAPVCPGPCPPGTPDEIVPATQDGSAFWLAVTPTFRSGTFEAFGKVGVAWMSLELTGATRTSVTPPVPGDVKRTSTQVLLGAGIARYGSNGVGVRLEVEQMGSSVTQTGLSLAYRF